jgi:hypothetical protein
MSTTTTAILKKPVFRNWTICLANLIFERQLIRNDYDEEQAYKAILDFGCPLELADKAWDNWSAKAQA